MSATVSERLCRLEHVMTPAEHDAHAEAYGWALVDHNQDTDAFEEAYAVRLHDEIEGTVDDLLADLDERDAYVAPEHCRHGGDNCDC